MIVKQYSNDNVLNFGIKRALRQFDDLIISNFLWYFNRYEAKHGKLPNRKLLELECKKEAKRRGIDIGDGQRKSARD